VIPYSVVEAEVISRLEIDSSDASKARFNIPGNILEAWRRVVRDFPYESLRSCAQYDTATLKTSGIHTYAEDQYIRIFNVFVDYDNDKRNTVKGYRAIKRSQAMDMFAGKSFIAPSYDIDQIDESARNITIEPLPRVEVPNGLVLQVVLNVEEIGDEINLEYALLGPLVSMAVSLCAMVDNYNPEMVTLNRQDYIATLQSVLGKAQTNES
jgi:hypothetical protein